MIVSTDREQYRPKYIWAQFEHSVGSDRIDSHVVLLTDVNLIALERCSRPVSETDDRPEACGRIKRESYMRKIHIFTWTTHLSDR